MVMLPVPAPEVPELVVVMVTEVELFNAGGVLVQLPQEFVQRCCDGLAFQVGGVLSAGVAQGVGQGR